MKKLLLGVILLTNVCMADEFDTHFAAHFGTSYAFSMFVYGVMEKGLGCNQTDAFVFAAVTTAMVGIAYKVGEISPNSQNWPSSFGRAMVENGLGIGATGLTIKLFNW